MQGATISRAFQKAGLYRKVAEEKPTLKKVHIKVHMASAAKHKKNSVEMWEKVLWSDVAKIGQILKRYVWC